MDKKERLIAVSKEVNKCQRCRLYKTATRAVPGEGNPETKVMFIGEGPGYYEDQSGRPFVGQAGKLLEKLLSSIGLKREDVFIGNVVKHRPPENRDPQTDEIEACKVWLDQQIEVLQPELIVTLGRFSMAKFIPEAYISRIHGQPRFVDWEGRKITVIPMYHPAAALRNSAVLTQLETDFQKIRQILNKTPEEEGNMDKQEKKSEMEQLDLL